MDLSERPPRNVFVPEEVSRLTGAFERSWKALSFAFTVQDSGEARAVREALAICIVSFARAGEKDPMMLSNRALATLPPYAADRSEKIKMNDPPARN